MQEKVDKFHQELHHALKKAKGFERQRLAKRLKDGKSTPEKIERLQKEVVVLKSLDLHQAAHAHLCASLLKFKSIAEAPDLPSDIKAGPPKPDISEEERAALHNVTSALYNRKEVRDVLDKAIAGIGNALGIPVPPKRGKGAGKEEKDVKTEKKNKKEEGTSKRTDLIGALEAQLNQEEKADEKAAKKSKKQIKEAPVDEISDEEAEQAISKYEALLGGSSDDEDSGSEGDDEVDPMEITDGEEEDDDLGDIDLESEEGSDDDEMVNDLSSFGGFSSDEEDEAVTKPSTKPRKSVEEPDPMEITDEEDEAQPDEDSDESSDYSAISRSPSPKRKSKKAKSSKDSARPTDSTFLPSLMGGYISGSESASDVDLAPPRKNRRGQRARQAIWEKKFKAEAKHLSKPQKATWDPKRGAVEGKRTPWKAGVKNPFAAAASGTEEQRPPPKKRETMADKPGPLHPSWEAKKKAQEKQQTAAFAGTKIRFD